jgi:hypothetical protein
VQKEIAEYAEIEKYLQKQSPEQMEKLLLEFEEYAKNQKRQINHKSPIKFW